MSQTKDVDVTAVVRERYGQIASQGLGNASRGADAVAAAFGYSADELSRLPSGANLGLSCGNPTAMASLRSGEVVVDLGCGGGLDVFLAAQVVGPHGKAIGIDMTPQMIERAKANAQQGPDGRPYTNVEFHLGQIDRLPLSDATADCVISNCVVNLAADKSAVFREVFRVLKPGGRVAISDIALRQALPTELAASVAAWVGCIAGAISIEEYQNGLRDAGFTQVKVIDSGADLNAYKLVSGQSGCCSPVMTGSQSEKGAGGSDRAQREKSPKVVSLNVQASDCCSGGDGALGVMEEGVHRDLALLAEKYDLNTYAASVKIFAIKTPVADALSAEGMSA